jgi:toxin-antitoxin system PIN domain toxin
VIAVDTNILVYAHRKDSQWHEAARLRVGGLAEGKGTWAIPWPCLHEFFGIVTHPRIFAAPTPTEAAWDQIDAWLEAPGLALLAETPDYWPTLRSLLRSGRVQGPQVHDARIAALCLHHGVARLWTADRDFSRFPELEVANPLIG